MVNNNKKAIAMQSQKPKDFTYNKYVESNSVKDARNALSKYETNNPGEYTSAWQSGINEILNKILNREDFSYDFNKDALYQQYKDQYINNGKMAMEDAIGQAVTLSGGYDNSYAQTVGQQTYQNYLQNLNDRIPELYQLALDVYNREGEELYNQYALLNANEDRDYGRYRDAVSDYNTELARLTNLYYTEADRDYGQYIDSYNMAYNQHRDNVSDWQNDRSFYEALRQYEENLAYQKERDAVSDAQWQKQYNLSARSSSGVSSSGRTSTSSHEESNNALTARLAKGLKAAQDQGEEALSRFISTNILGRGYDANAVLAAFDEVGIPFDYVSANRNNNLALPEIALQLANRIMK